MGDLHHGGRVGGGIHPSLEGGISRHFGHECSELSFGHGTIPWVHPCILEPDRAGTICLAQSGPIPQQVRVMALSCPQPVVGNRPLGGGP
jgi:hypothetical protein